MWPLHLPSSIQCLKILKHHIANPPWLIAILIEVNKGLIHTLVAHLHWYKPHGSQYISDVQTRLFWRGERVKRTRLLCIQFHEFIHLHHPLVSICGHFLRLCLPDSLLHVPGPILFPLITLTMTPVEGSVCTATINSAHHPHAASEIPYANNSCLSE